MVLTSPSSLNQCFLVKLLVICCRVVPEDLAERACLARSCSREIDTNLLRRQMARSTEEYLAYCKCAHFIPQVAR